MSDTQEDIDQHIFPEKKRKKQKKRQCKSYMNKKKIETKHHKKSKTFSHYTSISPNHHFKQELYKKNNYLRKLDSFENIEYDIPEKTNIHININIAQTDKNVNSNDNENGEGKSCFECFMSLCMRLIKLLVCIAIL